MHDDVEEQPDRRTGELTLGVYYLTDSDTET